jgi:hypothetical protein
LDRINHVVFVEVQMDEQTTEAVEDFNLALTRALQDRRFMYLRSVRPSVELAQALPAEGRPPTLEQLSAARRLTGADGIIYGCITRLEQYPRMQVGLRLRMLDLRKGQLLWAVDHVWDTTDRDVEQRMDAFFRACERTGYEPVGSQLALISPRVFAEFVSREVAATIPPRSTGTPPGEGIQKSDSAVARLSQRSLEQEKGPTAENVESP